MKTSPEVGELAKALSAAQSAFPEIKKDRTVKVKTQSGEYSYQYADLATIIEATRQALGKAGLAVTQATEQEQSFLSLRTRLIHSSGQWVEADYPLPGGGIRPQDMGSALTYARRYSLCAILGIATEEDDDGRVAQETHKPQAVPKKAPAAPAGHSNPAPTPPLVTPELPPLTPEQLERLGITEGDEIKLAQHACEKCGGTDWKVGRVKKEGANKGKLFITCLTDKCGTQNGKYWNGTFGGFCAEVMREYAPKGNPSIQEEMP